MDASAVAAAIAAVAGIALLLLQRHFASVDSSEKTLKQMETEYEDAVASRDLTRINLAGQRLRDARIKAGRDASTGL